MWYAPWRANIAAPRADYVVLAGTQDTGQESRFRMSACFIDQYEQAHSSAGTVSTALLRATSWLRA